MHQSNAPANKRKSTFLLANTCSLMEQPQSALVDVFSSHTSFRKRSYTRDIPERLYTNPIARHSTTLTRHDRMDMDTTRPNLSPSGSAMSSNNSLPSTSTSTQDMSPLRYQWGLDPPEVIHCPVPVRTASPNVFLYFEETFGRPSLTGNKMMDNNSLLLPTQETGACSSSVTLTNVHSIRESLQPQHYYSTGSLSTQAISNSYMDSNLSNHSANSSNSSITSSASVNYIRNIRLNAVRDLAAASALRAESIKHQALVQQVSNEYPLTNLKEPLPFDTVLPAPTMQPNIMDHPNMDMS